MYHVGDALLLIPTGRGRTNYITELPIPDGKGEELDCLDFEPNPRQLS